MPDDIETIINRVATTMPNVTWAPPDEIRREAESGRRHRIVIAGLAAVVALAGVSATVVTVTTIPRPPELHLAGAPRCPDGLVPANIELPDAEDIRLHVYNGTTRDDLADEVAQDLRTRDFVVVSVDRATGSYPQVAVIRYGPRAVGAGWVMRSYFLDQAATEFLPERDSDEVDIVLGDQFQQLATRTEVNQSIASLGRAMLPAGTCAAD